jgi:hypothetical protein
VSSKPQAESIVFRKNRLTDFSGSADHAGSLGALNSRRATPTASKALHRFARLIALVC